LGSLGSWAFFKSKPQPIHQDKMPIKKQHKSRKTISLELKERVINDYHNGKKVTLITDETKLSHSTVSTIIKNQAKILEALRQAVPVHSTILTAKRNGIMHEMERLLMLWMQHQWQKNAPLSLLIIQSKARNIFEHLKSNHPEWSACTFIASKGWFHRFRCRHNYHNVHILGEIGSANPEAAEMYKKRFATMFATEEFLPEQIFNVDETAFYWKRMPTRTYTPRGASTVSGFKISKDRLTLLLGGNLVGYKLKPLLVYNSENPRALKNIDKNSLPVFYRSNRKAWMTALLFEDWFSNCFVPEVRLYCEQKNIPFKILLLLDNAPGHSPHIADLNEHVKVDFMPPNTTSLIQPMDQGVISTFKAYYLRQTYDQALEETSEKDISLKDYWKQFNIHHCITNIDALWNEISESCIAGCWNALTANDQINQDSNARFYIELAETNILNTLMQLGVEAS
jgi:hypothetical protein